MDIDEREAEAFDVPKIHKWVDNIEGLLNNWSYEDVFEHFGVDNVSDLTEEDIEEVQHFVDCNDQTYSAWVLMGFKNLISEWEMENYDDD
jgi:hypothetical protein